MNTVLVTGASGFIGSRLVNELSGGHRVIAFSRHDVNTGGCEFVRGSFTSARDLRALDQHRIDTVVHLASAHGNCSERTGLAVNVAGSRTFFRYVIDRGWRHIIVASSIAATGAGSANFIPRELPIGDHHPCEAIDPYGLSKGMMEEVACYFQRQNNDLELTIFRIGLVLDHPIRDGGEAWLLDDTSLPFIAGGLISISDVLDALVLAVDRRLGPGARRLNLVGPYVRTRLPVYAVLPSLGIPEFSNLDVSYFSAEGREATSLYSVEGLRAIYGFIPSVDVRVGSSLI